MFPDLKLLYRQNRDNEPRIETQITSAIRDAILNMETEGKIVIIQNMQIVLNNAQGGGATINMR